MSDCECEREKVINDTVAEIHIDPYRFEINDDTDCTCVHLLQHARDSPGLHHALFQDEDPTFRMESLSDLGPARHQLIEQIVTKVFPVSSWQHSHILFAMHDAIPELSGTKLVETYKFLVADILKCRSDGFSNSDSIEMCCGVAAFARMTTDICRTHHEHV